ncbi:MAG: low specificity L-threonine aldolase [Treponema sp.]|nr:low specificity L-threonine aldolase [Treponema sp.]
MISFESDYIEGAHPKILEQLMQTNMEQLSGYGNDIYSTRAKEKIKQACKKKDADVAFLVGGTQTNQIIIDTVLKPYEGVIAASTGHVSTHEAGAIEYTGHKVLCIPEHEGKIKAPELKAFIDDFYNDGNHEHEVFPGMVYISQPTEYGTIYTKKELEDIYETCSTYSIPLYIDGARLGYALMSSKSDTSISDIASLCDIFYIGGTKVGALCGEAVVFTHNNKPAHFETLTKQHGALLAKGRLLGIQFDVLFTDDLYFTISRNAIEMADMLKQAFLARGYQFYLDSPTNQQFIILENKKMEELKQEVGFSFWQKFDNTHTVVRFATSWATTRENIEKLIALL